MTENDNSKFENAILRKDYTLARQILDQHDNDVNFLQK
jgi:hypothetical protein